VAAQPANLLVGGTAEFLRRFPPFNEMDGETLAFLAAKLQLAYFAKGDTVLSSDSGTVTALFIVQRGFVNSPGPQGEADGFEFGPGEMFPLGALLAARATARAYVAAEDSFCYTVDTATFEEAMRRSPVLQRFTTRRMDTLLRQVAAQMRNDYASEALGQDPMTAPLATLIRGKPVTCAPETPIRDALTTMQKKGIGSIVAVDGDGAPVGIFTERDLLNCTVAGGIDLRRPAIEYMTRALFTLPPTATVYEGAMAMAKHNIRHMLVVDHGRLVGVLSERSLFALQRMSMRHVLQSIGRASDRESLKDAAGEIHKLARSMLAQGVGAEHLTQLIATLNDKLTERILDLEAERFDLAGIRFCWLALGSEGRHEQTFASDQDNAIVFVVGEGENSESIRTQLLPFAHAVNETLDFCEFPLCKGNIMASNPQWTLSESEWRQQFGDWIRNPVPEALLNGTIFFDFRPMWGDFDLATSLRDWLNAETQDNQRFLRMMAANALDVSAPISFLGDIQTSSEKGRKGTIDLKSQGTRIFTDIARIYALAEGVPQSNTAARLRATGPRLHIKAEEIEAMVDSFHYLLLFRLRHQHFGEAEDGEPNRIRPDDLNELDRRILKEAFRQARKGQRRLGLDYQLRA
jgi:CBS domain-containing protein